MMTGCSEAEIKESFSSQHHNFKTNIITTGLEHPWSLAFLPAGEYLVTERRGKLWRIDEDGQKFEIARVPEVQHEGQGGLLDVILDPNFEDNKIIYFSYSATAKDNEDIASTEVAKAKLNLKQNKLDNIEVIFTSLPKLEGGNHWGSRILFAPDGYLYITIGERFNHAKQAQNPKNHLGSVIRIKPDGSPAPDNPFINDQVNKSEIFSFGHRNPQGIAWNYITEQVWLHEHGPKGGDEINILKSGANYGWPLVTFGINYWGTKISDKTTDPDMEDSILQWTPSIAPSGMAFYQGNKFPKWQGDLFVGALAGKHLRRLKFDGSKIIEQEKLLSTNEERIRDVRIGQDGFIYVLSDEDNGRLFRLEPIRP